MTYADLEAKIKKENSMFTYVLKLFGGTNWLIEKFLEQVLFPVLKRTGSNWTTVAGILLLIASTAISALPDHPMVPILQVIVETLKPVAAPIKDAGVIAVFTGFVKKCLNFVPK